VSQYVALIDWTDQGVRNFKDTVDRYEAAESTFKELGGTSRTSAGRSVPMTSSRPSRRPTTRPSPALLSWPDRATSARRRSARSPATRCEQSSARRPEPITKSAPSGRTTWRGMYGS